MRVQCFFLLVATLLILVNPSNAEIYKWVDGAGKVHFSDKKPDSNSAKKLNIQENTYSMAKPKMLKKGEVVMFSTSWCVYCKKARNYFKSKSIAFVEYDIERNAKAKRWYQRIGGKGVPVILIGDKRLNGFSKENFERLYY
ncbi:MAG: glutaredoxin [Neolewinella sp.]|jgi:glutaredoxin